MDGSLDEAAEILVSTDELTLYTAFNGATLYMATEAAPQTPGDVFILLAQNPGEMLDAPWAKSGQVAAWDLYLGNENSNNWAKIFFKNSAGLP